MIKRKINGSKSSSSSEEETPNSLLINNFNSTNVKKDAPEIFAMAQKMMKDLTKRQERLEEKFNQIYFKSEALRKELKDQMTGNVNSKIINNKNGSQTRLFDVIDKENNVNVRNIINSKDSYESSQSRNEPNENMFKSIIENYGLNNVKNLVVECIQRFPSLVNNSNCLPKKREVNLRGIKRKRSSSTQETNRDQPSSLQSDKDGIIGSTWFEEANSILPLINSSPQLSPIKLRKKQSALCVNEELKQATECQALNSIHKSENNPFDSLISQNTNLSSNFDLNLDLISGSASAI